MNSSAAGLMGSSVMASALIRSTYKRNKMVCSVVERSGCVTVGVERIGGRRVGIVVRAVRVAVLVGVVGVRRAEVDRLVAVPGNAGTPEVVVGIPTPAELGNIFSMSSNIKSSEAISGEISSTSRAALPATPELLSK